jgi:outer membrane cobalamin receptor
MRPICLLLLLAATPAVAQTEVVVTATRTGEGPAAATSLVTADDIARLQPVSLIDVLNTQAGVRAISTGGAGGGSFVSIRGGEPNFTLVMIDGVRVNDPTNSKGGAFDFSLVDPALVDSIAVSRGAVSAVHGSDALSGVINIRLRDAVGGEGEGVARVTGGSNGEVGGGLSVRQGWTDGGLLLAGGAYDSNDATRGSTLRRAQLLGRARQRVGSYDLTAFGMFAANERRTFPEDSGGPELAVLRDLERGDGDLLTAALALRHLPEGRVQPHASVSYSRQTSDVDTPPIAPGTLPGALQGVPAILSDNRLERLEAIADVVFDAGALTATIGGAYLDEDGRSIGSIDFGGPVPADFRLKRRTASGFAEATLVPIASVTLNGAIRHDAVRGGPREWTGRAGVSIALAKDGPALFARIGEGFKLPSFYALGSPLIGNPALLPERSRNVEAGLQWRPTASTNLRVAWFDNTFSDLIDFDPATFTSVNRSRVTARGVEAETNVQASATVGLAGQVTYLELQSATPLRARPRWQGNVRGSWAPTSAVELSAILRFNDDFFDSSIPTGLIRQDGHVELDAGVRYRLSPTLRLDVALRNLAGADYQDAVGFPARGPSVRTTLSATIF